MEGGRKGGKKGMEGRKKKRNSDTNTCSEAKENSKNKWCANRDFRFVMYLRLVWTF